MDESKAFSKEDPPSYQFEFRQEDRFAKCLVDLRVRNGVAVDPQSCHVQDAFVYQDLEDNTFSAYLTKTDVVDRKNSYYKLQVLLKSSSRAFRYFLLQTYGSIGAIGYMYNETEMSELELAIAEFKRIFEKLTDNPWPLRNDFKKKCDKMNIVEIEYMPNIVGDEEISLLPKPVQELIELIVENPLALPHLVSYNPEKWPLGKLTSRQIEKGYAILYQLLGCITENNLETIICLTNVYYSLVPRILESGRVLDTLEAIQAEFEFLDRLPKKVQICPSLDLYYSTLATKIRPMDSGEEFYKIIKTCVRNNGPLRIKITEIFELEDQTNLKQDQKNNLLWFGCQTKSLTTLLSRGFVAHLGLFGLGIYFHDMVQQALEDCRTTSNISFFELDDVTIHDCQMTSNTFFLMLCEVALGNREEVDCNPTAQDRTMTTANFPYDSILACGTSEPDPKDNFVEPISGALLSLGKPIQSKHQQAVRNYNQYVVYNEDQVKMRYLVKIHKRLRY